MTSKEDPSAWADRLGSADLPADVAAHYARTGTPFQRSEVARSGVTPLDVLLLLAEDEDDDVALSILANWEAPTEVVELLLHRFPDREEAQTHPRVSVRQKLGLPVFKLASFGLSTFFEAVRATEDEQQRLQTIANRLGPNTTLGEAWRQTRWDRWPRPN